MCVLGGIVLSSVGVAVGGDWDASRSPKNVQGKYKTAHPRGRGASLMIQIHSQQNLPVVGIYHHS